MNKLEIGMKFRNLRELFIYLGIDDEYCGAHYTIEKKSKQYCEWHRLNRFTIVIDKVYDKKNNTYTKRQNFTDEEFKQNYLQVKKLLGKIPIYSEFRENTKISINSYANHFKFKGKVYDNIVKLYSNIDEYSEYLILKRSHKTNVGKMTGKLGKVYEENHLETNLRYIFDSYKFKYKTYPTKRIFDNISPIDNSMYRNRYHSSWTEICKSFGYNICCGSKEETLCLNMCKEILNCDYEPQRKWEWLKNVGYLRCDGYFESLNLVIEYDGEQHRKPITKYGGREAFERIKRNDEIKDRLLKENNIKLIRIDSRDKWWNLEWLEEYLRRFVS